ncbi:uncharacterized protein LOC110724480 [Chenopodium quinoa]|uniref:uncharacterized protein LOC110724480 n=1 Tax=Chenopodium quinoa TaxID=63459 RepID=UPI000B787E63|nr:uncharacterized protein LOC110724480 [Chenopodium quinoa]
MSDIRDEIAQSRQISTTTNQKSNEKKIENTGVPEQSKDVPFKVIHLMQFDNGMFNPYPIIHERKECSEIDNKLDRNEVIKKWEPYLLGDNLHPNQPKKLKVKFIMSRSRPEKNQSISEQEKETSKIDDASTNQGKKTTEEEAKTDHLQQEKAGSELVNTGNQSPKKDTREVEQLQPKKDAAGNESTEDEPPKEATAKDQPTQQVKAIAEDEPSAEEEPPKEDEPPAAVEETHSYIMQKKKLKVSTQGILKKLTKNWKNAPVSKVIAAKKAPATTVDTAGKATAAEMAPAKSPLLQKNPMQQVLQMHNRRPLLKLKKILLGGEEIEIEDETEEELERQRQEELQRDEELTRILRDVKLPGISAIATAAAAIAENLPAATTPKKPGRPRVATAVAEKPAEKTGRTRAAVIGKAGQKGGQKRPAASAKGPAKKRKVIDQVPYDKPSEDEEQEEVPATSSAPAENKILKK